MEAPPTDRFRTTGAGPRPHEGIAALPLYPVLFAAVIALAAVLVALMLYPLFGALDMGTTALNDRLESAGAAFTRIPHPPERSTIYAADGSVLATLFLDENRQIVRLRKVAPIARDAVLAIEDDGFYGHGPINVPSVFRAMLANLIAGRITQGGSTITQQLVKNAVISTNEQTFARKFQEAALAMRLEQKYSKDKILEMYLNEVYFGNGVYGIGTASQHYFGKPASKLNLPQGALLAGLIAAPEQYNPVTHPQRAEARRNEVLGRLATLGWVPQLEVDRAMASSIRLAETAGKTGQKVQPFFIHYITQSILDNPDGEFDAFGKTYNQRRHTLFQGGLKIYTTLRPDWQRYAQEAVDASSAIDPKRGPDVSLVSVDAKTGAIRAMLSGKNYRRDQLDLVWQGRRQVGSAFKPFTLVAAFQEEFPPGKVYSSKSPFCSSLWLSETGCVSNAEGAGDRGYIDLWTATQNSVNVVFAQLALDVGAEQIVKAARQMGIASPLTAVPSITLGTVEVSTLDMAAGFSTLANGGVRCRSFAIGRVVLPGGEKLYQHKPECRQVIDPDIAHLVTAMLQRVVCCGTGSAAQIGRPIAGKTGTAQDYTNVYFAGYTPQVATAVWVGFPEGQVPMDSYYGYSVFGGTVAAPIWQDFMVKAVSGMPVLGFPAPPPQPGGEIPNVVGLRSREAQEILVEANFTPIVEKVDSSVLVNTVFEQSPEGGTTATLGSGVKLTVSNGKGGKGDEDGQPVLVPNVVGLAEKDAVDALKAAGLEVDVQRIEVSDPNQDGIVQIQSPAAYEQVPAGSTVTIWVGQRAHGPGLPRRRLA
ncbi:MAG TPA: transglycosylase domain-containing protein [Actinomycetota bacterium]